MEIVHMLPDKWDGTSGTYQGKDLSILPYLMEIFVVPEPATMLLLVLDIIRESSDITNENISKKVKNGR